MIFGTDDYSTGYKDISEFALDVILRDLSQRLLNLQHADHRLTDERQNWAQKKEETRQEVLRLQRRDSIFCAQINDMAAEIANLTRQNQALLERLASLGAIK